MFHYVLHKVIRNLRERKKLTQKAVALRGGISAPIISKWETGDRRPGEHQLGALCQGLGCTEIELWNEHIRLQEAHYRERSALLGERPPESGASPIEREIADLLALRLGDDLAPDVAETLRALRGNLVNLLSLAEPLVAEYTRLCRVLRAPHPLATSPTHPSLPPGRGGNGAPSPPSPLSPSLPRGNRSALTP